MPVLTLILTRYCYLRYDIILSSCIIDTAVFTCIHTSAKVLRQNWNMTVEMDQTA